jgi:hypothetical protein
MKKTEAKNIRAFWKLRKSNKEKSKKSKKILTEEQQNANEK